MSYFRVGGAARGLVCAAVLACAAVGMARAGAGDAVAPRMVVAIGGGLKDDNEAVFKQLLARGDTNKIVIVPYSSADAAGAAASTIARFKKHRPDATYLTLPDASKDAESMKLAADWIAHADLVYFTGGDQSRLIPRFCVDGRPNAVLQSLQQGMERWGTVVGGTSAGAACMSDPMFLGGGSESALADLPARDGEDEEREDAPRGVRIGTGLGLVHGVVMDSHFLERGRYGRMVAALEKSGKRYGVGVNENRAVVAVQEVFTGIGPACAMVVDTGEMKREGMSRLGVRVSLLGDGDEFSALTGEVRLRGEVRASVTGVGTVPANGEKTGAWDKNVLVRMLVKLAADPATPVRAESERFEVVVSADERSGFVLRDGSLSARGVRLDIRAKAAAEAR